MKTISALSFTLLLLVFSGIRADEEGGGEEEEAPADKPCQKWIFDLLSVVFDAAAPCIPKALMIRRPDEIVTRVFCLVKCLLVELGLLDDEGKLDQASAAVFFGENFPANLRNEIVEKADPCFKLADAFDGKEYYCKSYADFAQCAGIVVVNALVPYVIQCFGSPFIAAGLNAVFGLLTNRVPSGRSLEPMTLRLGTGNNGTLYLKQSWKNYPIQF